MAAHWVLTREQSEILRQRRRRLAELLSAPVLLWAGGRSPRNFPHNSYPYRASSHFLYFAGIPIERAVIRLQAGRLELFMEDPYPAAALWHGPSPTREQWAVQIGADKPLAQALVQLRLCQDAFALEEMRAAAAVEDDVLITPTGCEVLAAALPSHPEAIEAWMLG